jgi:type II secretory pathway predicted ATPase ExeA
MPYLAHFGLKDSPFSLTPDVEFYFPTHDHSNIIASIDFALRRDTGIIKIVGEVGTGKTLLCRLLIKKLIETDSIAYINAPRANAQSMIAAICEEFGLEAGTDENGSPYSALNRFLLAEHEKGKISVVIVDEAQHLGKDGLEAVRLVSNLETEKRKLLQIVLFGQTELDDLLKDPALRQLNQRVVFSLTTKPMTSSETKRYITHRIGVSRQQGVEYEVFSPAALDEIAAKCGGIPRVTNILADKSLLVAFSEGSPVVSKKHAKEAIADSRGLLPQSNSRRFWRSLWPLTIGAALLVAVIAAAGLWQVMRARSTVAPAQAAAAPSPSGAATVPSNLPAALVPVGLPPVEAPPRLVPFVAPKPLSTVSHAKAKAPKPHPQSVADAPPMQSAGGQANSAPNAQAAPPSAPIAAPNVTSPAQPVPAPAIAATSSAPSPAAVAVAPASSSASVPAVVQAAPLPATAPVAPASNSVNGRPVVSPVSPTSPPTSH